MGAGGDGGSDRRCTYAARGPVDVPLGQGARELHAHCRRARRVSGGTDASWPFIARKTREGAVVIGPQQERTDVAPQIAFGPDV